MDLNVILKSVSLFKKILYWGFRVTCDDVKPFYKKIRSYDQHDAIKRQKGCTNIYWVIKIIIWYVDQNVMNVVTINLFNL